MSRRDLQRQSSFNLISAEVGDLDADAFDQAWSDDPDQALELLSLMTQATDRELAALAQRLAGRLLVDLSASGPARSRGVSQLVARPARADTDDLDIDASVEAIHGARVERRPPRLDELTARQWAQPTTAICLLVDRSGSMNGSRLATAALAAAACSWRAPNEFAVLAFADKVLTIKSMHQGVEAENVVGRVLSLRGHGTTDVALALRAAHRELQSTTAQRRMVILLSDGEHTTGDEPTDAARALAELAIVAPAEEPDLAFALGRRAGAKVQTVDGPLDIVGALSRILS